MVVGNLGLSIIKQLFTGTLRDAENLVLAVETYSKSVDGSTILSQILSSSIEEPPMPGIVNLLDPLLQVAKYHTTSPQAPQTEIERTAMERIFS